MINMYLKNRATVYEKMASRCLWISTSNLCHQFYKQCSLKAGFYKTGGDRENKERESE